MGISIHPSSVCMRTLTESASPGVQMQSARHLLNWSQYRGRALCVAELGASRMEETIGSVSLRDAAIGTGIAVDKMLALTGQTPALQIANIVMPTDAERAERRAVDAKLDAIAAKLKPWKTEP